MLKKQHHYSENLTFKAKTTGTNQAATVIGWTGKKPCLFIDYVTTVVCSVHLHMFTFEHFQCVLIWVAISILTHRNYRHRRSQTQLCKFGSMMRHSKETIVTIRQISCRHIPCYEPIKLW